MHDGPNAWCVCKRDVIGREGIEVDSRFIPQSEQFQASPRSSAGLIKCLKVSQRSSLGKPKPLQLTESFNKRDEHSCASEGGEQRDDGVEGDSVWPFGDRLVLMCS